MDELLNDNVPLGKLTVRQRRQMGLTFRGALQAARELNRRGEIHKDMDSKEISALIAEEIMVTNAKAWADNAVAIDWDAILAFIEKLIPLILKLIELFSKF